MKKLFFAVWVLGNLRSMLAESTGFNLSSYSQDFIVEAKQIKIPGFPGAFNASIIRWQGSLLMCFRVRNEKMVSTFEIGFVELNEEFEPISTPRILKILDENPACLGQRQDPRLIILEDKLYIIYSNFIKIGHITTRRMFIAPVHIKNKHDFYIVNPLCLHPFEGWSSRWEKNWVPFIYKKKLLLAYSLAPHRIFEPSLTTGECTTHSATRSVIDWKWGELRGGTPALKDSGEYVAFFHSSTNIPTAHSQGKKMTHYFMGAYTFAAKPPFEITRVSPKPIVASKFYDPPYYNTWKPLRVVFPMGCVKNKDHLIVTFGRQDFEIWVVVIDKKKLYNSLVMCPKNEGKDEEADSSNLIADAEIDALYTQYLNNYVVLEHNS